MIRPARAHNSGRLRLGRPTQADFLGGNAFRKMFLGKPHFAIF